MGGESIREGDAAGDDSETNDDTERQPLLTVYDPLKSPFNFSETGPRP